MREMNREEALAFEKSRDEWQNYKNIDEYIEDVVTLLVYSPWHYSEEHAREIVDYKKKYVENAFKEKTPANDCSAEVGFFAG